jgi:hypothetical protein
MHGTVRYGSRMYGTGSPVWISSIESERDLVRDAIERVRECRATLHERLGMGMRMSTEIQEGKREPAIANFVEMSKQMTPAPTAGAFSNFPSQLFALGVKSLPRSQTSSQSAALNGVYFPLPW